MKQLSLATFLATALLLGVFGCSKKGDPAGNPAVGSGSYILDGRTVSARASAVVTTSRTTTGQNYDELDIQLITTPQPQSGAETLDFTFQKPAGQSSTAYQLNTITLLNKGRTQRIAYNNDLTTFSTTSGGGFSGTFSATATGSTIRSGAFTEVRP